ncbi:MAG: hypothetical protein Tsb0020_34810 [Haliangiales bacterium]
MSDAVVLLDSADRVIDINPAAARLLGRPLEALRDRALTDALRFREPPTMPAPGESIPITVVPESGTAHVIRGTFTRLAPPDPASPSPGGLVVLSPEPPGGAEGWRQLLSDSGGLHCVFDRDGYFDAVGPRWSEHLGYRPDQLLSHRFIDFIHPDDLAATLAETDRLRQAETRMVSFEARFRTRAGSYRWLSWCAIADQRERRSLAFGTDITDLRRQARLLRETQGAAQVGGWELDVATQSMYWTEENYRIHGTTPAQYTPTVADALGFYSPDSAPRIRAAIDAAIRDGTPFDLELEMTTASGERIWCRDVGHVIREDGKVTRVYGSCQDITEQRRNREALRDSERRLRELIRDIRIGVLVQGPQAEILQCNEAALTALGVTEDQLLGRSSFDPEWNVIREDGSLFQPHEHPVPQALARRESVTDVIMGVYRPGQGDRAWLLVNAMVQPDADGELRSVVCSFTDITARKRAEDAARAHYATFRAVYTNAGLGIILRRPDGALIDCNPTFELMIGHSTEDLHSLALADYIADEDLDPPADPHKRLLEGDCSAYEIDRRYRRADGETLYARVTVSAVVDDAGRVVQLVEMVTDITDRKRMESQLMLSDRLASLGTMAAGVAHEINNPLTWLMGNISYVLEYMEEKGADLGLDPTIHSDFHRALDESLSGAERIRIIVQDLRLVARTNRREGATARIDRVVESTLRMIHNQISHRAKLERHFAPVPTVIGDEARLGQVMTNLIINAVQALPEAGHEQNRIDIRVAQTDTHVVVEVSDNGVGIPPEVQANIFDPFFTTKSVGEGTGLGLSICHGIVTDFGGLIEVDSELGRGTTFRVLLLIARDEPAPAAPNHPPAQAPRVVRPLTHSRPDLVLPPQHAAQAALFTKTEPPAPVGTQAQTATPAPDTPRRRILCVDDEPDIGDALTRLLSRRHNITFETDGGRALDRLRAGERYDAVICDLMMPAMSGMEFYRTLSDLDPDLAARCGFITGGTFTPAAREFAATMSPARILRKPFGRDSVQALIDSLVA